MEAYCSNLNTCETTDNKTPSKTVKLLSTDKTQTKLK